MLLEYFPLGPATRERLNFLIEADPRAVRHEVGVALEIACQACGGAQFPAEDPERVISLARARAVEDGIVADDPLLDFSDLGDAVQWLLDPGSAPFDAPMIFMK